MAAESYYRRFPAKYAARKAVAEALADGRLVRQPCAECGRAGVHGHHNDYARPLDVTWFCVRHHLEWHRIHGPGLNGGDAPLLHAPGGNDLRGMKFGKLRVLHETAHRSGSSIVWQCICDCGITCLRSEDVLHNAVARGFSSCCRSCAGTASFESRRRRKRARLARAWARRLARGGSLWTHSSLDLATEAIRAEVAEKLGFEPDHRIDLSCGTRAGSLLSGSDFPEFDGESMATDGWTLDAIADTEGVTRERIRQIETKAMARLRVAAHREFSHDILHGLMTKPVDAGISLRATGRSKEAA